MNVKKDTIQFIKQILSGYFSEHPDIVSVHVFGSVARQTERKESDIDLAFLLEESTVNRYSPIDYIPEFEKKLGRQTDLVILNNAGELLKYQVRRTGILIYDKKPEIRKRFELKGRKTYEDFLHLHKRHVKKVLYGDKNG
ncbi:MAG: nucleotidyltransferase domain-containing protein [Deltaproteobacteria bacterium]|nr:nucleotidyltransferase domain-containing protein [Deltaproteobacteria bacterium]